MNQALVIAVSMAAAFIVIMIANIAGKKSGRQMDSQFDERQIIARNKAYMTGFFVFFRNALLINSEGVHIS